MKKFIVVLIAPLLFTLLLTTAESVFATGAALKIDSVHFAGDKIEILGKQFDTALVTVELEGSGELTVVSVTNSMIEAELPPGLVGVYELSVSTGNGNKQNDDYLLELGGTMTVVCLDWYLTAGHEEHIHVEAFVQDQDGNAVVGAAVTLRNTVDTGEELREWQLKTSTTFDYLGYNHGASCPLSEAKASGASGQFCCIGLGAQEPFCPTGHYQSEVLSVEPPEGSNIAWDGVTPDNGRHFISAH
jgi:hypothetical protein